MLDLKKVLETIEQIQEEIKGLSLEQACRRLGGYSFDGELFDYDYPIDQNYYLVGTIVNDNGKAVLDEKSFIEIWTAEFENNRFQSQVLAMTRSEIEQQVERLK